MSALSNTHFERRLAIRAEAVVPTRFGPFRTIVFRHRADEHAEHVALTMGDLRGEPILLRLHSACMTGEVFGALACDCKARLDAALEAIAHEGRGAVVYLREHGLAETSAVNDLARSTYEIAAGLLLELGVSSVRLMTNVPAEVVGLASFGVRVEQISL